MSKTRNAFNTGNIWTIAIGVAFLIWGTFSLVGHFYPSWSIPGTYWLLIPGGIMVIAGIANIINYRYNRERVLAALKSYNQVGITHLSNELKLKEKEVKEIVVDLRTEGRLKASFDPESGDIMVLEAGGQTPVSVSTSDATAPSVAAKTKDGYCQYCGSLVKPDDRFCNNCGSAM